MTDRSHLSIGEVLSLLREEFPDVTISKIRFLESQGLVDPERTPSGYRKFYDHDVDRLRWILRQQREHFLPLKVIRGRLTEQGEADDLDSEPSGVTFVQDLDDTGELPFAADQGGLLTSVRDGGFGDGPGPNGRPAEVDPHVAAEDAASPDEGPETAEIAVQGSLGATAAPDSPGVADPAASTAARDESGSEPGTGGASAPGTGGASAFGPHPSPLRSGPATGSGGGSGSVEAATAEAAAGAPPGVSQGEASGRGPASQTSGPPARPSLFSTLRPPSGGAATSATSVGRPAGSPSSRPEPAGPGGTERRSMRPPTRPGAMAPAAEEAANFTAEELAAAAGGPPNLVSELKQYGLIAPHAVVAGTPYFDEGALTVARAAASFAEHGIEVRHLKPWRNSAEREAGLFEQVVLPLLRQRNPQSRQQATDTLADLARLGGELRAALVDLAIREIK